MKKIGKQTIEFCNLPVIKGYYSVVGPKEGEGPLSKYFDKIIDDSKFGEETWEKAESKFIKTAIENAIKKAELSVSDIDYIFSGDLLNQCASSSFAIRDFDLPFFGLYGACSTMAESLSLGAVFIDGEFANNVVSATSSHYCSAERQFRFPLEYGGTRPATSQWTVTGSGAVVLSKTGNGPKIKRITTGKIVDLGIKDANNMGAAMAPAAADTLITFLEDTKEDLNKYDLIVTGDLGSLGLEMLKDILKNNGYVTNKLNDCGLMIYDLKKQDVHSGGSGCGCSASVLTSYILGEIINGKYKNVLFMATGALMSTTTTQQGESIPGIAHLVEIQRG